MPTLHAEPLLFCLAWAVIAIAGGVLAGLYVGAALVVGPLLIIMPLSMKILSKSGDLIRERQVRWGILVVAALALLLYLNL